MPRRKPNRFRRQVRVVIDEQLPQLTFTWLGKNIAAPTVADGGHRIAEALLPVPVNATRI